MQTRITQAVIAAGGKGTRLCPTTNTIPKVMIPILGKPLLEWHIDQFKKHGVQEFFLTLQYFPEVIRNYFSNGSKWGVTINYFVEKNPLGSAGGIKAFSAEGGSASGGEEYRLNDKFFFIYGDTFSLVDYSKMVKVWEQKPEDALGMQRTQKTEEYADADMAELDGEKKMLAIHPKPHQKFYPNAHRLRGIFILRKSILNYIPKNTPYDLGKQLLPDVIARGLKFYGYECEEYSKGIDTVEKWREVESYLKLHA